MATSWTEADIAALEAAIASGVQRVVYNGPPYREVTYQSTDSMLRALAMMQREVQAKPKRTLVVWKKGFR